MTAEGTVRLDLAARTDLGRTRDHNEDTFLCADLTTGSADLITDGTAVVGPKGTLFLVADGMGGAAAGEIASAMAAEVIFQHLRDHWTPSTEFGNDEFVRHLKTAVEVANDRIHDYAVRNPDSRGMGTTATVVGVAGSRLLLAQVGDSRAYLVRNGITAQLTKDQSLMQRLIDAGEMTEEQAAQSERRNIILQALGPDARIRVDVTYQDVADGDTLVLCSDGLSGQVKREEIGQVVEAASSVGAAADDLIEAANQRGGPDNITAVVVRFHGASLPPAASTPLGYQVYQLPDLEPPPDPTVPVPPAEGDELPEVTPEETTSPPAERTGSPVIMAAIGVGVLLLLLVLFLLLAP